jgi:aldehyde:ferredoxin oxidoreductase
MSQLIIKPMNPYEITLREGLNRFRVDHYYGRVSYIMSGGYMGKVLRVDLWREKVRIEPLPPESILRRWLGGRGLGVYYMLKEVNPKVDPFSPENKAIVATGPVTGVAGIPAGGRWVSVTKSPLTNTIHDSHSGGKFGPELKFASFDLIIIEGKAERPIYLWIYDGKG